jgi:hypothetical protein
MPTPDTAATSAEVDSAVRALDRQLRRLRIPRAGRAEIVAEVRADLGAAVVDGLTPEALLGDVEAFAREAAAARGHAALPRDSWSGAAVALAAGAGALVVGYLLVEVLHPVLTRWIELDGRYPVAGPVLVYGILAVAGLAGALAGFARLLAGRPAARSSVVRAAVLLPIGAALGGLAAVAFGRSRDFATSAPVIATEVLLLGMGCAAALRLARWWALRPVGADTPDRLSPE